MGKWTTERIDLLKGLWQSGASLVEMAEAIGGGLTKNAIVGKGHRLCLGNLSGFKTPPPVVINEVAPMVPLLAEIKPQKISEQTFRLHAASVKTKCATLPDSLTNPVPKAPLVCERVSIWELTRRDQCRWPLGDPKDEDFAFCGLRVADTTVTSYCPGHRQLSITILPRKAKGQVGAPAMAFKEPLTA